MRFDPTVSWGTILTLITFIMALVVAYQRLMVRYRIEALKLEHRLIQMETKLNLIWASWRRDHDVRKDDDEKFFNGTESR